MKGKLAFLVGGAVGYVAGTAAGRQRYEQLRGKAQELWRDSAVRDKVDQATSAAAETATQAAGQAAAKVKERVGSSTADPASERTDRADRPPSPAGGPQA